MKSYSSRPQQFKTFCAAQEFDEHERGDFRVSSVSTSRSRVVRTVHRDGWFVPAGMQRPAERPVPEGMDWDLWIGPSPYRSFNPIYHPWTWRAWWDFGTGTVGDMACHAFHVF